MFYNTLKAELTDDPVGRGYAAMTAEQAAASLNAADRSVQGPVPIGDVLRWSAGVDGIYMLREASERGTPKKRQMADAALQLVNHPHVVELDVTDPELAAMLDGLVALSVFTSEQVDALKARGVRTISRAEQLGIAPVKPGHVEKARAQIGA